MIRTRWILVMFLAAALPFAASAQTATQPKHHKSRRAVKPIVLPPLPPGPLPPVPLDQLPSVPPQVSYQGGELTIVAQNSTLGDILREVRKRTGASFDIPANANDRVATRVGPGPARDVLATLLNGTSFNYVMVGSSNDPGALSSLVLTAKPAGTVTETAQNQPAQPVYTAPNFGPGTGRPGFMPPQPAQAAENADDKDDEDADNSDDDQQAEGQPSQPGIPVQQAAPAQQTDANGQPVNAGPRTPQQILQLLQQQRQQLQQQQQQQQQNQDQPPQEQ